METTRERVSLEVATHLGRSSSERSSSIEQVKNESIDSRSFPSRTSIETPRRRDVNEESEL